MTKFSDVTASLLTPRGRGAVATILLRGDVGQLDVSPALFRAANGRPLSEQPVGRIVYGRWRGREPDGDAAPDRAASVEDVVVCRVAESETEIHCHGGDAASHRILDDLRGRGAAVVEMPAGNSWTRRRLEADCLDVASRTTTARTADIALQQAAGALRTEIEAIANLVENSNRLVEETLAKPSSETIAAAMLQAAARLRALLRWSEFGPRLAEPRRVALVGRPNVGKSSLMNALVGHARSIVRNQPGTTRDVVTAETAFDGWPLSISDTAGLRAGSEEIESEGIARARHEATHADLVLLVVDLSAPPTPDDLREECCIIREHAAALVVGQKSDLPRLRDDSDARPELVVSAETGLGVEALLAEIVRRLFPDVPPAGTAVPLTTGQVETLRHALAAADQRNGVALRDAVGRLLEEGGDDVSG